MDRPLSADELDSLQLNMVDDNGHQGEFACRFCGLMCYGWGVKHCTFKAEREHWDHRRGCWGPLVYAPFMPLITTDVLPLGDNPLQRQRAMAMWNALDWLR